MSFKFNIIFWLQMFLVINFLFGQSSTGDPVTFTLEECLDYAFENSDSIKNAILDQKIAKAQIGETRSAGLPQIDGNASISKSYIMPVQLIPADVFPNANAPAGTFIPVQFSPTYMGNASVQWDQLIFDGSYFVGLQAASTYQELSSKATIKTKIDVAEAVTKAYYAALVAQERIALAEENFRRLDTLLRETRIMHENGFAERIEVSRVTVERNNAKVERQKAKRAIQLSFALLKFQMNMALEQPLILGEDLDQIEVSFNDALIHEFEYSDRIEYSQLETNKALAELELKNIQVQYLPKLNAFINVGATMGANESSQLFDFKNSWFENGSFGASLSLPIFDGLNKSYRIQQSKLALQRTDNTFNTLRKSIDLSITQSRIKLQDNVEMLEASRENMALAREVYDVSRIKYQEGVGSNIEVIDAEIAYQQAETNYYNALYDALAAKVELKKALGVLLD